MSMIAAALLAAAPQQSPPADPHAGHAMHAPAAAEAAETSSPAADAAAGEDDPIPEGKAPPVPTDHAANDVYDPAVMARARDALTNEHGGMTYSKFMLDRLEFRSRQGADGYAWEGEGWIGGDINRFAFKTEGEGEAGGQLEEAEVQLLYSRAIDPWFNIEGGVRHDVRPGPQRTYAVVGIDGLAPYWFEVGAQAFLSNKGDAHLRLTGSYDQRITQRLILQPAVEANISAQDVPELGIASGLSDIELGLRLRYEIAREFAPYVGVEWQHQFGGKTRLARDDEDESGKVNLVMGVRFWF